MSEAVKVEKAGAITKPVVAACGAHADGQKGLRAFVAKRKPSYSR